MRAPSASLLLVATLLTSASADFNGPRYPPPVQISSDSAVATTWTSVTSALQAILDSQDVSNSPIPNLKNLTFSMGMFSIHDPAAVKMQFHYTSPEIANSPNGTHKVDADSIYRIASITKVFAVLTGLLNINVTDWELPVSQVVPGIEAYVRENVGANDPALNVQWDKITLAALSAQLSGIAQNPWPIAELGPIAGLPPSFGGTEEPDPTALGFPPLGPGDQPDISCIDLSENCDIQEVVSIVGGLAPTFQPWTHPAYSNNGFILLGLAIANITGQKFGKLYNDSILHPLGMTSTSSVVPPVSEWNRAVIPGDPTTSFLGDSELTTGSGGVLSTINDLAKFGVAILNSTLMKPEQTRRWMKPVSLTADLQAAVGRPWEILRYIQSSGVVTDIYSKSGDSGLYSSLFALLPDYGVGFTILSSSSMNARFSAVSGVADTILEAILPALAEQAAAEAAANYAGTYQSTIVGLNSSLTLAVNTTKDAAPGLYITSLISNGTDALSLLPDLVGKGPYRLQPTIADAEHSRQSYRLLTRNDPPRGATPLPRLFSGPGLVFPDWLLVGGPTYGGLPLTLFVFDVDGNGKSTSVELPAWRAKLRRVT